MKLPTPPLIVSRLPSPMNMALSFVFLSSIFIGACIYYDRMRHSDPDFPRKLQEQRKQRNTARQQKQRPKRTGSELEMRTNRMQVIPLQGKRLTVEVPSQKYEDILLNEICIAETYMKDRDTEQALIHFATAIAMSYDPTRIINSLKQTLPPMMYNNLACVLNERYENKFAFMFDDRQLVSRISIPVPQHSMLFH